MTVLVDTSVWRRWFIGRPEVVALGALLDVAGMVLVHRWVLAELALGGLSVREQRLLGRLPVAPEVPYEEVMEFVSRRELQRSGVGWVDVNLLASALTGSALLWTVNADLQAAAKKLGVAFKAATKD